MNRPPWGIGNYVGFLVTFLGYYILGMIFVLVALRNDISLDSAIMSVRRTLEETKSGLELRDPKTPRSRRTVALPTATIHALRKHRVDW